MRPLPLRILTWGNESEERWGIYGIDPDEPQPARVPFDHDEDEDWQAMACAEDFALEQFSHELRSVKPRKPARPRKHRPDRHDAHVRAYVEAMARSKGPTPRYEIEEVREQWQHIVHPAIKPPAPRRLPRPEPSFQQQQDARMRSLMEQDQTLVARFPALAHALGVI